jgi:hypothetical protein
MTDQLRDRRAINSTLEHLLELPAELGAERNRRIALVFDEFQQIVEVDPSLLPLLRSVFQKQPDVAHVFLGSKRHMMERIFNDENEPFWRSAEQMELGVIPPPAFARFICSRFEQTSTGRGRERGTVPAAADVRLRVCGLQELRPRPADDDVAADHLGPFDVEPSEVLADELERSLV